MQGKLALYCLEDKTVLYIDSKENDFDISDKFDTVR